MEHKKLIPKQWFMQKHEFLWKITDFVKMRNNKQALELQHFDFNVGSSIEVTSEWKCFLTLETIDQFDFLRPDVALVGDIPDNAHFLTVIFFQIEKEILRVKADIIYQTSQASILDLFQKVDQLKHPLDPEGGLTLNVSFYICNMQRIPPNISHNDLMVSILTWFYEHKFINKWQDDFQTMYKQDFGNVQNLRVKLITKDGREFLANRAILGVRSPVFLSMFETPMFEAQEGVVKIDDISGPAFEALLSFMYTGMLPGNWKESDILEEFIYGAFKYMLEDLQKFCGRMMVFLWSDEKQKGIKQNLEQLAEMLNIKMEEDWNACLENFIKEDCHPGMAIMLEKLKLKQKMEPRLLMAFMGASLP